MSHAVGDSTVFVVNQVSQKHQIAAKESRQNLILLLLFFTVEIKYFFLFNQLFT